MRLKLLSAMCLFGVLSLQAQVGVGTASPHNSSILDVSSTSKGFLLPRMDSVVRSGISSPAEGLLVYDTTENKLYIYREGSWVAISSKEES